jgi:hypothetical protein
MATQILCGGSQNPKKILTKPSSQPTMNLVQVITFLRHHHLLSLLLPQLRPHLLLQRLLLPHQLIHRLRKINSATVQMKQARMQMLQDLLIGT